MSNHINALCCLGVLVLMGLPLPRAQAGVFNLPRFVSNGSFAIGVEPSLVFGSRASLGFEAKYTHGITDLSNLQALVGTSNGSKKLRLGLNMTFDFIPDIEGQPGIGIAAGAIYYRLAEPSESGSQGQTEAALTPYIHKSFSSGGGEVDPFIAFPVGISLHDDRYKNLMTAVIGAQFKSSPHIAYSIELGVGVLNTDNYVSAGVTYYH